MNEGDASVYNDMKVSPSIPSVISATHIISPRIIKATQENLEGGARRRLWPT